MVDYRPHMAHLLKLDELGLNSGSAAYDDMIETVRGFLDALAAAAPDEAAIAALDTDVQALTERLAPFHADEAGRIFGCRRDIPGRGQTMAPAFTIEAQDATTLHATVVFRRYFLGVNNAAHGGSIALLFDEILGILGNTSGNAIARTAYLHSDYRSITPIGVKLDIRARLDRVEGRKRFVRGEIWDGERLCVEAEGLFVELKPGQA